MAVSVRDQMLFVQGQKIEATQRDVLEQLVKLTAIGAEIRDQLTKIHDCICKVDDPVESIGADFQPPTPK